MSLRKQLSYIRKLEKKFSLEEKEHYDNLEKLTAKIEAGGHSKEELNALYDDRDCEEQVTVKVFEHEYEIPLAEMYTKYYREKMKQKRLAMPVRSDDDDYWYCYEHHSRDFLTDHGIEYCQAKLTQKFRSKCSFYAQTITPVLALVTAIIALLKQ